MSEKPKVPKITIEDRLTDQEYLKLKQFAREYMGLDKNYGKHARKKPR